MVFILQYVNIVYHIDLFAYIEESLHPWDKSHLIMVYDPLMCCQSLFASILLRIFASMFISDIGLSFSFFVVPLSGFGIRERWWPRGMSLGVFLPLQIFGIV